MWGAATTHAASGSIAQVAERGSRRTTWCAAIRSRTPGAAGVVGGSPTRDRLDLQLSINAQGRLATEEDFATSCPKTSPTADTRCATSRGSSWRLGLFLALAARNKPGWAIGIFAAPGPTRCRFEQRWPRWPRSRRTCPRRRHNVYDRRSSCAPRSSRGAHLARIGGARRAGGDPVPADLRASIIPLSRLPVSIRHVLVRISSVLDQRAVALAWCSRSHRGRRRDRGVENVERNMPPALRRARRPTGRCASHQSDHRDRCGARRRVRAARVHHGLSASSTQFALTIAISTVISAINSLTLSPALAALMLKRTMAAQELAVPGLNALLARHARLQHEPGRRVVAQG